MCFRALFRRLIRRTDGQDLIEYALLSTFCALAVYLGVTFLGNSLSDAYTAVENTTAFGAPCTVAAAAAGESATDCGDGSTGGGGGTTSGGGGSTSGGGGSSSGGGGSSSGGGPKK